MRARAEHDSISANSLTRLRSGGIVPPTYPRSGQPRALATANCHVSPRLTGGSHSFTASRNHPQFACTTLPAGSTAIVMRFSRKSCVTASPGAIRRISSAPVCRRSSASSGAECPTSFAAALGRQACAAGWSPADVVHAARNMNVETIAFICAILPVNRMASPLSEIPQANAIKGQAGTARSAATQVQIRLAAILAQPLIFKITVQRSAAMSAGQWRRSGCRPLRSR